MALLERLRHAVADRWLPRRIEKQSATFPMITMPWQAAQGVPRPETIATFADFGRVFRREVWVYACVKRIAEAAADVPLLVVQRVKGEEKPLESHPLLDLFESINPYMGKAIFIETLMASIELMGNGYIEKVRKTKRGPPVELYPLRPDRMRVIPDPVDYLAGFLYEVNGRRIRFEPQDVMHLKTYNPLDDYYGLSTLEAAALSVEHDQFAIAYNRNFFRNNAMPEGVFTTEAAVKQEDVDRVKQEFEKNFRGPKNTGKVGFLGGKWTWVSMGMKQREAQFIDSRKMSREEILAAFGVPPVLVGLLDGQFAANVREQLQIFWKLAMLPRLQRVEDQLNEQLASEYGEDIRLRFDLGHIEALREDENDRVERVRKLIEGGIITRNEAREEMGLETLPLPGMDDITVPFTVVPLGTAPAQPGVGPGVEGAMTPEKARLTTIKTARWREFMNDVEILAGPMAAQLRSLFIRQREEVIRRLHEALLQDSMQLTVNGGVMLKQRITLEQIMFDVVEAERELEQIGRRAMTAAIERRGARVLALLGADFDFNLKDPRIAEFLSQQVFKFKRGTTESMREEIRQALVAGERLGEGITQIADRINAVFHNAQQVRSLRIAQTEMVGAANFGSLTGMSQSGVVSGKQWLSARDGHVRESHQQLDAETDPARSGAPVSLMAPFSNGLMYPGDQAGAAEEVVNCRCVLLEVISR